jgi:uncharacterized membrane protein YfhO
MSKNAKIIIAVVLVVLVIVICCFTFGKNKDKENDLDSENTVTNEVVEIAENVTNETESNSVVENEVVEEEIIENVTEVKPQGTVYESNSNAGTTDKKQDAIALVKEKWGEDPTVTFRCDSVSNNGEYIIAVVSKESASVKNYFKVNLATKTVEIDY